MCKWILFLRRQLSGDVGPSGIPGCDIWTETIVEAVDQKLNRENKMNENGTNKNEMADKSIEEIKPETVGQKPSTLIFYPFAYALLDDELSSYCWYCLSDLTKLKKCTGCQTAYFCGKPCQALGWKDHKVECKSLKKSPKVPNIEVRLLARIVSRYKAIETEQDTDQNFYIDRKSDRKIMEIWAHTEDIRNDHFAWIKFESIFTELTKFYGETALVDKETVFQLHCRDFINRHAISDNAYLKEIAKGLYLDLCAYDHSCAPNAIYTCKGFVATLRPLNSQVNLLDKSNTFYTYIDLFTSKQQRQKMLKDTWYFDCECSRCLDNGEHLLTSMKCPSCENILCMFGTHDYKDPRTQVLTCRQCLQSCAKDKVMEAVRAMRFIGQVVDKCEIEQMEPKEGLEFASELIDRFQNILPKINVYYCRLIQAIIPRTDPENVARILEYHLEALDCMRMCYPDTHPALAFHLMNIGTFYSRLKRKTEAVQFLTESQKRLDFVLGEDHLMTKSNRQQLNDALNLKS